MKLLSDAARLTSPFSGEGVNHALDDAVDLVDALTSGNAGTGIALCEEATADRAEVAAEGAAHRLKGVFSKKGAACVLLHNFERVTV